MIKARKLWYLFRMQPTMYVGIAVLLALAVIAVLAPWIATYSPTDINPLARMKPPSEKHLFGTDAMGRDIFSRVVWGARVSLVVAVAVAAISLAIGIFIGVVAGYFRKLDMFI